MPPLSGTADLTIRQIIRQCGLKAVELAHKGFEVMEKGYQDYVTTIDKALDQDLFSAFSSLFPQDGVITEENVQSQQYFHTYTPRLWCIDPIDGTEDFIHGRQGYAVMVGLLENYQPVAGWIYAPGRDELYFGGISWGLFQAISDRPPTPMPVTATPAQASPLRMLIGHRDQQRYGAAIAAVLPDVQFQLMGSFGLKVLEVILGRADIYLYLNRRVKLWDTVAPLALAKAAGLTCCSLEGEPIGFSHFAIEPNSLAHKQAILIGHPPLIEVVRPEIITAIRCGSKT